VRGLQGARYLDKVEKRDNELETATELAIDRPLDRVYYTAPGDLAMFEGSRGIAIRASGFPDTVVWNPAEAGGSGIADLEPGGYARMVCVEAAASRRPITVGRGDIWRGGQTLAARG
jgi:glucose-6-phosphate 1-epimerase